MSNDPVESLQKIAEFEYEESSGELPETPYESAEDLFADLESLMEPGVDPSVRTLYIANIAVDWESFQHVISMDIQSLDKTKVPEGGSRAILTGFGFLPVFESVEDLLRAFPDYNEDDIWRIQARAEDAGTRA